MPEWTCCVIIGCGARGARPKAYVGRRWASGGRCVRVWLPLGFVCAMLANGCGASAVVTARLPAASRQGNPSEVHVVRSGSMEPTLPLGARVVVRKNARPIIGAIVVVDPPDGAAAEECGLTLHTVKPGVAACDALNPKKSELGWIERIVAGPGDEIYIREGHVYRRVAGSGKSIRQSGSFTRACGTHPGCDFPDPIRIPAGQWFVREITEGNLTTVASGGRCRRRGSLGRLLVLDSSLPDEGGVGAAFGSAIEIRCAVEPSEQIPNLG
jgi:signal peptidase I